MKVKMRFQIKFWLWKKYISNKNNIFFKKYSEVRKQQQKMRLFSQMNTTI